MKVATLRASTSRRTEPSFRPALERLGERLDPGLEDDGDAAAEALVERRHLLREVVERTAQLDLVDQALVAELVGDDLEHHLDAGDRIAGVAGEWPVQRVSVSPRITSSMTAWARSALSAKW